MSINWSDLHRLPRVPALLGVVAAQLILLALLIHQGPTPRIKTAFDGATVLISADRAWTTVPGQCVAARWELQGIASVYVNGQGKVGRDEIAFCPTPDARNLVFSITSAAGESRDFTITVHPDLAGALASWLLWRGCCCPSASLATSWRPCA